MQIHVLEEIRPELAAIDGAVRRRELEFDARNPSSQSTNSTLSRAGPSMRRRETS